MNRIGLSSVYLAVCVMFAWPRAGAAGLQFRDSRGKIPEEALPSTARHVEEVHKHIEHAFDDRTRGG
jgi:hypothetical protein